MSTGTVHVLRSRIPLALLLLGISNGIRTPPSSHTASGRLLRGLGLGFELLSPRRSCASSESIGLHLGFGSVDIDGNAGRRRRAVTYLNHAPYLLFWSYFLPHRQTLRGAYVLYAFDFPLLPQYPFAVIYHDAATWIRSTVSLMRPKQDSSIASPL
ncbi:hypothetical protein OE88DRAFT_1662599 [Heliocybe sulcata]|uniref:Secreted protein n=1 Tax=Heliocybe sulcata TaxID=5364 RepID=A0A5C3MUN2_9AGAM|nr:hypothetical protein OE88DRAFT_1662599 [Heliocybe sulcata]